MRKSLEFVGVAALLFLCAITWRALNGPNRLPDRIPTHFDIAGQPNGWGPPSSLWMVTAVALLLYVSITVVSFFPSAFNYPVRVTPRNRDALQGLALEMITWLKVELSCLFAWIRWATIDAVRHAHIGLSPLQLPLALAVFGTMTWYLVAMRRAGKRA